MKALCSLIIVVVIVSGAYAQTDDSLSRDTLQDTKIFAPVEEQAEFPGGMPALMKFLSDNISYPKEASKNKIQGKVYVRFIVEKDGSLSNISVFKGVSPLLDQEALRVVALSPTWTPGKQRGKPIRSQFVLPINFSLNKKNK